MHPADYELWIREAHERTTERIAELTREFDAIVDASDHANLDDEHDPEGATVGFERAQVSALLERARTQLADLDAATERLRLGTYGACERCGAANPGRAPRGPARNARMRDMRRPVARASGSTVAPPAWQHARMPRRVSIAHVAALDGLRGVAVAGVLAVPRRPPDRRLPRRRPLLRALGVPHHLAAARRVGVAGAIGLGEFWARRARRLLPALAGVLVGVALYCVVFASPAELGRIRGDALATIGYVANWRSVFAHQDYWALFQAPSPLQHTWSLAIEEQFYLVWPLVVRRPRSRGGSGARRARCSWSPRSAARRRACSWRGSTTRRTSRARTTAPTRGRPRCWRARRWPPRSRAGAPCAAPHRASRSEALGLVGIAFLAWAWTHVSGQSSFLYRGGFLACGLAVVAVIAAATHPRRGTDRACARLPAALRARARELRRLPVALAGLRRARRSAHRSRSTTRSSPSASQ